jgi:ABC-2 type transport system permease protein
MNGPLNRKYWSEAWLLFVACGIGVVSFCWFRTWVVGELDTSQFRQIIDLLPKDWRNFASVDFDWLVSYLGRTALALDEPMLVMFVSGWVLVRGSDVVSGELGRGTMEMLLAQPVSRRRVFLNHAFWTLVGLGILMLLCWFAMAAGIWTSSVEETTYPVLKIPIVDYPIPLTFLPEKTELVEMSAEVDPIMFLPGIVNLFFLGWFLAGFAAMLSAFDRFRWRTLGLVSAFYFSNAGIKILGMSSAKLAWVKQLSIFGFYSPASVIQRTQTDPLSLLHFFKYSDEGQIQGTALLGSCLVLFVTGLICYVVGLRRFETRDLPAPM